MRLLLDEGPRRSCPNRCALTMEGLQRLGTRPLDLFVPGKVEQACGHPHRTGPHPLDRSPGRLRRDSRSRSPGFLPVALPQLVPADDPQERSEHGKRYDDTTNGDPEGGCRCRDRECRERSEDG